MAIARISDESEEVKFGSHLADQLKQYNRDAEKILAKPYISADELDKVSEVSETIVKPGRKHKVIRRRRKYQYSQANEYLATHGYWQRDKRSLTKFASNSLMFEYKQVLGFDGDKTNWK